MFAKFCKNTIFPSSNSISPSEASVRNEYRLPTPSTVDLNHFNQRQLPEVPAPRIYLPKQLRREPPPSYWASQSHSSAPRRIPPPPPVRLGPPPQRPSRYRDFYRNSSGSESDTSNRREYRRSRLPNISGINTNSNECLLDEDLFCPDLVRNCKSVVTAEDDDQDYIDIEELIAGTSQLQLQRQNEVGIPLESSQITAATNQSMGQNLSLKRPKISLTWILREQHVQSQAQPPKNKSATITADWNGNTEKLTVAKKRSRSRSRDKLFSEKYVSDDNLTDFRGNKAPLPTPAPTESTQLKNNLNLIRKKSDRSIKSKSEKVKKKLPTKLESVSLKVDNFENSKANEAHKLRSLSQSNLSLKNTYLEPSLYTTSVSESGLVRKQRRRRRYRSPKFGYDIKNFNEFLSNCTLKSPANIPVVLSKSSTLYQTRSGYQTEIPLPLGMVVNSVFKNEDWLYVQTPHLEEGYVSFAACLPMGILPNQKSNSTSKPTPCWESNVDIFPHPSGNMTDSEKEQMKVGTRSEGRRTPESSKKLKRRNRSCSEKNLDQLYLQAASQVKVADHSYAQLKPTNKCKLTNYNTEKLAGDYVSLQHKATVSQTTSSTNSTPSTSIKSIRQTLLAITENYCSDTIQVRKGDVVSLLACKEYHEKGSANYRQWFFIRNRDGAEGYIPSEKAGNGFL